MRMTKKKLCGMGGFLALMLFCVGGTFDSDNVLENLKLNNIKTVHASEKQEGDLIVPQKVKNNSYYEPIDSAGREISEQKAASIKSTVSRGKTGDGLTFEARFNPYYDMLSETEKALYRQIYANAEVANRRFALVTDADEAQLDRAFEAVYGDHPELFWLENDYKYQYSPSGRVAEMTLQYNITENEMDIAKADFDKAVSELKKSTYGLYTNYEKEKKVHDELINKVKFDANSPMNDSAYSALVNGRSASAGYARAYQMVLEEMGIPCYFVNGFTNRSHAWNIVELGDGFYNVDTAWDDTDVNTYDYFNIADDTFEDSHLRKSLSQKLPKCEGREYSKKENIAPGNNGSSGSVSTSNQNTYTKPTNTYNNTTYNPANYTQTTNTTTNTTSSSVTTNSQTITVRTIFYNNTDEYIDNLRDYYRECFNKMMKNGGKSMNFDIIINGEELWNEIYKDYANGGCEQGYTERYLAEKHLNTCQVSVTGTPRSDGSYLVKHSISCN